ncbi:hypothetical protein [Pseudomonas frederiksbergensis]|uniref:hypothetical protein n=1 Tax=Pseudomonas frederiksbergensis TaxID=104087 RepID=UPI000FF366B9|nr:hypothetical protein [Pseudomonas frederiksbergensis]RON49452.1 hypothetical protein BK667_19395 [Pseudomonas frederiksbergensis]
MSTKYVIHGAEKGTHVKPTTTFDFGTTVMRGDTLEWTFPAGHTVKDRVVEKTFLFNAQGDFEYVEFFVERLP